ncbi:protein RIK isoform X1 [Canna indica]|uniref:Protein RIK n=1 Tax=Canna indica TaxID=4628 RepID=A0AAQ3JSV0_9LILI|nr:protein RIK isoform X1 [Canna indica]
MTEDRCLKASDESAVTTTSGRQRKKRKWDQPAEPLLSAGITLPGVSLAVNSNLGATLPGVVPLSGSLLTNSVPMTFINAPQLVQSLAVPQNAATIIQKLNQPKIQDELIIAREIVINDAEPTIRYKLTKRQTQEEIQKCTGAVVITRGKYRPPNGLPDSEKPLYLHISAGAHLKDTAERIKAVDHAAAMIEEILKQGQNTQASSTPLLSVLLNGQVTQALSTCLFLGFDADPSLNIAARIRGPNDLYINHIMNETGATVVLRGRGSEQVDSSYDEEALQPLHLFLSSTNPRSLEAAKVLAENLLDTISIECGASRISSTKVYGAVPPPQQLLVGTESSTKIVSAVNTNQAAILPSTATGSIAATQSFVPGGVPTSTVTRTTCYNGYEGIYPQATPLQQVALALRQASASSASVSATSSLVSMTERKPNSIAEADAHPPNTLPPQKRKFKELPVTSRGSTALQNSQQGSEFLKPGLEDSGVRALSSMPPPKKLVDTGLNELPPTLPRNMPPPPPKFSSLQSHSSIDNVKNKVLREPSIFPGSLRNMPPPPPKSLEPQMPPKANSGSESTEKSTPQYLSDTLLKLAEYGEEEDEEDNPVRSAELPKSIPTGNLIPKPFWAI